MKNKIYYKGKGNHSINDLEQIVEEKEQFYHDLLRKLQKENEKLRDALKYIEKSEPEKMRLKARETLKEIGE